MELDPAIGAVLLVCAAAFTAGFYAKGRRRHKDEEDYRCRVEDAKQEASNAVKGTVKEFKAYANTMVSNIYDLSQQDFSEENEKVLNSAITKKKQAVRSKISETQSIVATAKTECEVSVDNVMQCLEALVEEIIHESDRKIAKVQDEDLEKMHWCFKYGLYDTYYNIWAPYYSEKVDALIDEHTIDWSAVRQTLRYLRELKCANYNMRIIFRSNDLNDEFETNTLFHEIETFVMEYCQSHGYEEMFARANGVFAKAAELLDDYAQSICNLGKAELDSISLSNFLKKNGAIRLLRKK